MLWNKGSASGVRPDLVARLQLRLSQLDAARKPDALNVPGFNFHKLRGKPVRYTIHVNGPWCVTFEWEEESAMRVDPEQYH